MDRPLPISSHPVTCQRGGSGEGLRGRATRGYDSQGQRQEGQRLKKTGKGDLAGVTPRGHLAPATPRRLGHAASTERGRQEAFGPARPAAPRSRVRVHRRWRVAVLHSEDTRKTHAFAGRASPTSPRAANSIAAIQKARGTALGRGRARRLVVGVTANGSTADTPCKVTGPAILALKTLLPSPATLRLPSTPRSLAHHEAAMPAPSPVRRRRPLF